MTFSTMLSTMAIGMLRTFGVFSLTLIGSLPLGMVVALLRQSRFGLVRGIIRVYISVIRGTPLMLQMFAVFFVPFYVFGIKTGQGYMFVAVIIAFIVNYAAYFGEIYRSGIQSMPRGQCEAAQVLGYSPAQTFFRIILPQVVKRILPTMGNEVVTLVKDTSLVFVLALAEMFTVVKQIVAAQVSMVPFILAALVYWGLTLLAEFILGRIEKHYSYYHD